MTTLRKRLAELAKQLGFELSEKSETHTEWQLCAEHPVVLSLTAHFAAWESASFSFHGWVMVDDVISHRGLEPAFGKELGPNGMFPVNHNEMGFWSAQQEDHGLQALRENLLPWLFSFSRRRDCIEHLEELCVSGEPLWESKRRAGISAWIINLFGRNTERADTVNRVRIAPAWFRNLASLYIADGQNANASLAAASYLELTSTPTNEAEMSKLAQGVLPC